MRSKKESKARRERSWKQMESIVGSLRQLPTFFKNGLYRLWRAGLSDVELQLACQRCRAWMARAKKNGFGECECPCGERLPVNAKNALGIAIWTLDHDPRTKTFRGILHESCNRELGIGDTQRKLGHASYAFAHEARLRIEESDSFYAQNEFLSDGAVAD